MPDGTGSKNPLEGRKTRAGTATTPSVGNNFDVHNALEGRKFLEKHLLLCPPGEPITYTSFASCLHQISNMTGVTKTAANAIRAIALLADEFEETAINETVRDAVNTQLTELTLDMKSLVADAKEKIDAHIQTRLASSGTNAMEAPQPTIHGPRSYAEALVNPPPHANPRLAAREGIRARQIMLEGVEEGSKVSQLTGMELKVELDRILGNLGLKGKKIRSAMVQKRKGILVEMENDNAVGWLSSADNRDAFCKALGPNITFKP